MMKRWLLPLLISCTLLGGCTTIINPVTGESEMTSVSEADELRIGSENYAPMRQMQGGDLNIDPELTKYVNDIGQRLAEEGSLSSGAHRGTRGEGGGLTG